jgi:hypothetical protein
MDKTLFDKAKRSIHRPLPHVESMYGWRLSTSQCFARAGGYERSDFGWHQCSRKPKYHVGQLQFCKFHAKEISPTLEGLEEITEPLFKSRYVGVRKEKF